MTVRKSRLSGQSMIRPHSVLTLALTAVAGGASSIANASPIETMRAVIAGGTTSVGFRYRLEDVRQENALEDATASTLRTRLTLQGATVGNWSALLEADNILTLGPDEYDSLQLDRYRGTHSVIADPAGTEINQALVRYAIDEASSAVLGRQRIDHAGQRFLGGVGWRQNEQTFDSASFRHATDDLSLDYSYLWNVNRVFGGDRDSAQVTDFDSDSHAFLAGIVRDWGTINAFVYAFDFSNAAAASSLSYGFSYAGKLDRLSVSASYARQEDHGDNQLSYSTHYLFAEASLTLEYFSLLLGYEVLGSDDGITGFTTPLATLHKFQGSADMFSSTPADGIEDFYMSIGSTFNDYSLSFTWHDFQSNEGSRQYGTEIDLAAGYRFSSTIAAELKYADYNSDGFAVDTNKFWLTINMAF